MGGVRRAPLVALTAVAALLMLGASACTGNSSQVALGTADRGSVTEVVDASATVTTRSVIASVQRGLASLSSALGALGAAQRAQAQSEYNLAKATVVALTLKAPIAGVVQLGGTAATPSSGSLGSLLAAVG